MGMNGHEERRTLWGPQRHCCTKLVSIRAAGYACDAWPGRRGPSGPYWRGERGQGGGWLCRRTSRRASHTVNAGEGVVPVDRCPHLRGTVSYGASREWTARPSATVRQLVPQQPAFPRGAFAVGRASTTPLVCRGFGTVRDQTERTCHRARAVINRVEHCTKRLQN